MIDVAIIGAGVVGLACAAESAMRGFSTLVVERHDSYGQDTSSRNSEVIHSGIYYPTGTLKATLCVKANKRLFRECEVLNVWHQQCGKLIVALDADEEPQLKQLHERGEANGVEGMQILDQQQTKQLEPNVQCHSAILVPGTGMIDSHELMQSYLHLATSHGATIAFGVTVAGGEKKPDGYHVRCHERAGATTTIVASCVINAAGLHCDAIAGSFGIDIDAAGYRLHPNRGHYYSVSMSTSKMISRLVYPLPHRHLVSAGIHITRDRAGQCRLGPDAEYLPESMEEKEWYKFDDTRKARFHGEVVKYFPALKLDDLSPGQVGVRPKLKGSESGVKDFIVREESERGLPGLINLIGIESPGLTCAREIARMVIGAYI